MTLLAFKVQETMLEFEYFRGLLKNWGWRLECRATLAAAPANDRKMDPDDDAA